MAFHSAFFLLLFLTSSISASSQASTATSTAASTSPNQSQFFLLMQNTASGKLLTHWDLSRGKSFCNFTGIDCNDRGSVVRMDISGQPLSGTFPEDLCSYLPELRVLRLARTGFQGRFPPGITNCSLLEELDMSSMYLNGTIPDLSQMKQLRLLDLSYNSFTGDFPMSVFDLVNLEVLNFNENYNLNLWKLPEKISRLTKLKSMVLTTCMLDGEIPRSIGNMTSLIDLELSGNFLKGEIPKEISLLKNLQQLELYYNELAGNIPEEFGNLTELVDVDMSVNLLTGELPESICKLPKLKVLQIYNNSLTGEIPSVLANSTTLTMLSLYDNFLTGQIPQKLGKYSPMVVVDLSENRLSGPLPLDICRGGELLYFLVLQNSLSGEIPASFAECESILRFRVSFNQLVGKIPQELLALPHVSIIDVAHNHLTGSISSSISQARNLSELFLQRNRISGVIPPEISGATNLVKLDLSNNLLSGPVPFEIGNLKKLNLVMLQGNQLDSTIPSSLTSLKSLSVLDLSNNRLSGEIPESLSKLFPNSLNLSNNQLSGQIPLPFIKQGLADRFSGNPNLCIPPAYFISTDQKFPICSRFPFAKRLNFIWTIGIPLLIFITAAVLFIKRRITTRKTSDIENKETLTSRFFDQNSILEAMAEKNIVGHGGSGTVYKIEIGKGEIVAVKRLWNRRAKHLVDKELKTEVETLKTVRHKNIAKLYNYFAALNCSLLVYEYIPNGNLWDALHKGWIHLDWPTRHRIAVGIAQGLAYLHHNFSPPVIHRDIKTTNILLDANYQPRIADFGIAKILQGGKDSTGSVIAGKTSGYLAPDSSTATTKCDVYSFGVVLMELITGKNPIEAEYGDNKNIAHWISNKIDTNEQILEILDKRLKGLFINEIIKALGIAIRCTKNNPELRPAMGEVVELLQEVDPCKYDQASKMSKK
ncbi:receptor protein-tyrosine kinase CEPR1-like isoform X2 [Cucurbita maxima]|uniref:Receptor protein-tyrosine kinase CEPR1-like isoform X2 n=1 Tax=Cucurbita maxima TaxID=3661 RepID=A0A6J1KKN8_CUCMA|nr:receptor protein-tyrosine kinase CEPR1-like isoform X2 [Cucurbita maxima]